MHTLALNALLLIAVVQPQAKGHRVHDYANLLSPADRQSLEQLSHDVDQKTTAEIVIVTIDSLEGQTIESYANELFRKWAIGKEKSDNGVLFLIAPKEHRTRFEVGYGVEPLLTDSLCGEIRDKQVLPFFKRNDFAGGILAGAREVANVLQSNPAAARGDPNSGPHIARRAESRANNANYLVALAALVIVLISFVIARKRLYSTTGFALVSVVVVVLIAVAAYLLWRTPNPQQPVGWFGGATAASLAAWAFNWSKYRRFGPHGCSKCGTRLELLREQDEDPKLSAVQQLEEKIGSVDYDVWICPACLNNDTERYIKAFSGFSDCPKCKARTFKEDPQRVVRSPTPISSGLAEVEGRCVSCNYKSLRKIVLPMIVTTTSSGSGSSSGGSFGGSSFGGGGGGFSGGGGGFGGGSSGGGGASGSW